jgi:FMN phosphatase YigB (HAD superfamily)
MTDATGHASLAQRIAGYDVVSCDIFDTALVRVLARPEDVLLAAGARLRGADLITCTPDAFRDFRLAAEDVARRAAAARGEDEPRLADVYALLGASDVVTDPERAARIEFEAERAACRAVVPLRDVLANRRAGQRLVFVSDTMLPGAWLAELLADAGYPADVEVLSSADAGRSKHSGRLFPHLLETLRCPASSVVHLGDNPVSDVAKPRAAGLAAIHLPNPWLPPEDDETAGYHHVLRLARSLRRAATRAAGRPDAAAPAGMDALVPYVTVLLIGFSLFVLAEARRRGIDRIYFLARDGYLPQRIAAQVAQRRGQQVELVYLHASRRSVALPAHGSDIDGLAAESARHVAGAPLREALVALGIDTATATAMVTEAGLDPQERTAPANVARLFAHQAGRIAARVDALRADALGYLEAAGFLRPGPRLVVDVGWRGTIQKALARLTGLPAQDVAGCYLGLWPEAMAPGSITPATTASYLFEFGHPAARTRAARDGYGLFELFFSAPHGSVMGYAAGPDGRPAPVHGAEAAPAHRAVMAALERGCLDEMAQLDALLGGAWPDAIDADSALADLAGLLTRPRKDEVAAIEAIPFIQGVAGGEPVSTVSRVPLREIVLHGRHALRRFGAMPWRAGSVRASLPGIVPDMEFADFRYRLERLLRLLRR